MQMVEYRKKKVLYDAECKEYEMNSECENMLCTIYILDTETVGIGGVQTTGESQSLTFSNMADSLTYNLVKNHESKILKKFLNAFVRVRSDAILTGGRIQYKNVPKGKAALLTKLVELRNNMIRPRLILYEPLEPTQLL